MDPTAKGIPVIDVEAEKEQIVSSLAENVSAATNQPTSSAAVTPAVEQPALDDNAQAAAEQYAQDEGEGQPSKLSYLIPALQKTVRTTQAINFLKAKMGWLRRKSGGEVSLK